MNWEQGQPHLTRIIELAAIGRLSVLFIGSPKTDKVYYANKLMQFTEHRHLEPFFNITQRSDFYTLHNAVDVSAEGFITRVEIPSQHTHIFIAGIHLLDYEYAIHLSHTLTADTQIVMLGQYCECGYYREERFPCKCDVNKIEAWQKRTPDEFLDMFDIVAQVNYDTYKNNRKGLTEEWMLDHLQHEFVFPTELNKDAEDLLQVYTNKKPVSNRRTESIIRVAGVAASINNSEKIQIQHIAEAFQYLPISFF